LERDEAANLFSRTLRVTQPCGRRNPYFGSYLTHCFLGRDSSNLSLVHFLAHHSVAGDEDAGFDGTAASASPPTPVAAAPTLPPPPPRSRMLPPCSPTLKRSDPPPPPLALPCPKSTWLVPSPPKRGSQKGSALEQPMSLVPPPKKASSAKKTKTPEKLSYEKSEEEVNASSKSEVKQWFAKLNQEAKERWNPEKPYLYVKLEEL